MVNEDIYASIAESLGKAKEQMARAEDLREFARDAGLPLAISEAEITDLKAKIAKMEEALTKRGMVVL